MKLQILNFVEHPSEIYHTLFYINSFHIQLCELWALKHGKK